MVKFLKLQVIQKVQYIKHMPYTVHLWCVYGIYVFQSFIIMVTVNCCCMENVAWFSQKYSAAQLISEGSCDTEEWSNDAENTALITAINYILLYITIENIYILQHNISLFLK